MENASTAEAMIEFSNIMYQYLVAGWSLGTLADEVVSPCNQLAGYLELSCFNALLFSGLPGGQI
jgi:hypothetical protein